MALKLKNGTYMTVEEVKTNSIIVRLHADEAHRERYKAGTETEFETTKQEEIPANISLESPIEEAGESILNNLKIIGYKAVKEKDEYKDATDV